MGIPEVDNNKYYTFEEYVSIEALMEEKHEYHNGKIVAMAGGTGNHSLIANRIGTALDNAIDAHDKNCVVFNADLKIKIDKYNKCIYPDASVVCGNIRYEDDNQTILSNPILLIEVLSKTSKKYDTGEKFEMYRSIPSFQEYMIIYQTVPKVQTWYKEAADLWRIGNAEGLDHSIRLHSIGCEIELKHIYRRIKDLGPVPQNLSEVY